MFSVDSSRTPIAEFDDVKSEMEQFSQRFNAMIIERKSAILSSKQLSTNRVKELNRKAQQLREEINAYEDRKTKATALIQLTLESLRAKHAKQEALGELLERLQQTRLALEDETADIREEVKQLEESLVYTRKNLSNQVAKDFDELAKFETYLGLKIVAVAVDLLKFRFFNVDDKDADKELSCELHVGDEKYRLGKTDPELPLAISNEIEDAFNNHGEIVLFLKAVRTALRSAA